MRILPSEAPGRMLTGDSAGWDGAQESGSSGPANEGASQVGVLQQLNPGNHREKVQWVAQTKDRSRKNHGWHPIPRKTAFKSSMKQTGWRVPFKETHFHNLQISDIMENVCQACDLGSSFGI